jgi:putative ABC transport system permease protein
MFLTYLLRELRRRARQAILIALGLALGIGLVITVTAASSGVKNAQADVLHSLYGVGTDITVTQAPSAGSGGFGPFGFGFNSGTRTRPKAGTKVNVNRLTTGQYGPISAASVTSISHLKDVAAATGALTMNDSKISLTIGNFSFNGGGTSGGGTSGGGGGVGGRGRFAPDFFSVTGVDLSTGALGPLSSAKLSSGRTFTASDATTAVAVVDANYARQNKLKVGSVIAIGNSKGKGTNFTVAGLISTPSGTGSDVYIPLAQAQKLAGEAGKVNTIYVAAANSADIGAVQKEISRLMPKATVTTANSLASEVTGSLSSAASLANSLGRWLAVAVLAAAFGLAVLMTMAAVARRVREFGTLKALGWRSRRIVGQVMGEALAIGLVGGVVGVGLGYLGSTLVSKFSSKLTATVGTTTGSGTPGGGRVFTPGGGFPGGNLGGGGGGQLPRGGFGRLASSPTLTIHLTAPVTISIIGAAVLLAIIGGLIAGGFGGWRAARLRPAAALARVA